MKNNNELNFPLKEVVLARKHLSQFLSIGEKKLTTVAKNLNLEIFKQKLNSAFEDISCVGFNPNFSELTATIRIKRTTGYGGNLCSNGSYEYVRFYVDYMDGQGWRDMGYSKVNVHDIPTKDDCQGQSDKPISYVLRHAVKVPKKFCFNPLIFKIKAVLTWNVVPPANDPNLANNQYVWGDVKEVKSQAKPLKFIINPQLPITAPHLANKGSFNPVNLSEELVNSVSDDVLKNEALSNVISTKKLDFAQLVETYKDKKKNVGSERFAAKLFSEIEKTNSADVTNNIKSLFEHQKLSFPDAFTKYLKLQCNTNYEELHCIGLDYHNEALIGTFNIKRPFGYNGSTCTKGSKEYVTFWIQDDKDCQWDLMGTTAVQVYDIPNNPDDLSFSAILPVDLSKYRKRCKNPRVLKLRAVLSWNNPTSLFNCSSYGNVIESYIQIRPGRRLNTKKPSLLIVGGVAVDQIDNVTGLTLPGAKLHFNQANVAQGAPFGGKIVVQGISHPYALNGLRYRIKVTNLLNGSFYYYNEELKLVGYDIHGNVLHHSIWPDVNSFYAYQQYNRNIDSILARLRPSGNHRIQVTIELENGNTDSQVIQLDNYWPDAELMINDNGDCSHYSSGDLIQGNYSVHDTYLDKWTLRTTICNCGPGSSQLVASGTTNTNGVFTIDTNVNKNCGEIILTAYQKTVGIVYVREHIAE